MSFENQEPFTDWHTHLLHDGPNAFEFSEIVGKVGSGTVGQ